MLDVKDSIIRKNPTITIAGFFDKRILKELMILISLIPFYSACCLKRVIVASSVSSIVI